MFEILFAYRKVLARHQAGPAAADRERYLAYFAGQMPRSTSRAKPKPWAKCEAANTTAARQHWRDQPALMEFLRAP